MKPLDKEKVKIRNLIGILEEPTIEDLLFEIVLFLDNDTRYESSFKASEAFQRTSVRINSSLSKDLDHLVELGYLEKNKGSLYKVVKHLWE